MGEWYSVPVASYRERSIEPLFERLFSQLPAILLVGPRATGKTTTAMRHAKSVVRLDDPAEAEAFKADPDAALRNRPEPVLLDEWQVVPEVLGAIKRSVDASFRPGRFLLTGSVRAALETPTWPGTGRLVQIPMFGMTVREQTGPIDGTPLIDRLAQGMDLETPADRPDLRDYLDIALSSGFPEPAISLSEDARSRWLESYVDQIVLRDAALVEPGRDPDRIRRYVEALTLGSAGVVEDKTLLQAARIDRRTAVAYERLLTNLLVVEALPAWTTNRLKRLVLYPKRYLTDAGLFAGILRVGTASVMNDGKLLGKVLDTFVVSQIRSELPITAARPRLYHLRTQQGRHEIDILAELAGGGIVAIEVKASSAPKRESARHLEWLREQLGDRFVAGAVLHTGPRVFQMSERIVAAPISTLWS